MRKTSKKGAIWNSVRIFWKPYLTIRPKIRAFDEKYSPAYPSNKQLKKIIIKLEIDTNPLLVLGELSDKIKSLDWKDVRKDVERFLKPYEQDSLNNWGELLFLNRVKKIVY